VDVSSNTSVRRNSSLVKLHQQSLSSLMHQLPSLPEPQSESSGPSSPSSASTPCSIPLGSSSPPSSSCSSSSSSFIGMEYRTLDALRIRKLSLSDLPQCPHATRFLALLLKNRTFFFLVGRHECSFSVRALHCFYLHPIPLICTRATRPQTTTKCPPHCILSLKHSSIMVSNTAVSTHSPWLTMLPMYSNERSVHLSGIKSQSGATL